MAETITPVVHGDKRRPYLVASVLHVAGATIAAAAFGLVLGGVGALLRDPPDEARAFAVALAAAVYLSREAFGVPVPLPDRRRQVPQWWRTFYSPPVAAFLYGLGLGVGVATYLTFGTFAAVMVGAVASGDPLMGLALCVPFGLGRAVAVVAVTWRGTTVDRLDDLAESPGPRLANAAALAMVTTTALATAL
ncbi:MAG TPA: hypothetical protein VHI71_05320 [Actinomycetota bacterium]|nr:hypothetical protein [Actinomycetota bacterium]